MRWVAVVGSGPSGAYSVAALLTEDDLVVDVIDALPTPYGLVRYGVAPDHPKIKSVSTTLEQVLTDPRVRFLGNVRVGVDVTVAELHQHYDAIVFAVGASQGRSLGIPGEHLAGSSSGVDFVRWYSGHPDAPAAAYRLSATRAVVVGAGNVALDVVRMLSVGADALRQTDTPPEVLDELAASSVREVHLVMRRGPLQTRFTTIELRELGEIERADVRLDPADLDGVSGGEASRVAQRNLAVLQGWAARERRDTRCTIHLHFWRSPVAILGSTSVTGVRAERTRQGADGAVVGTGEVAELPAELVISCIGYRGTAIPGVPFDEATGTLPHEQGRLVSAGRPVVGEYVAGWAKRGPTGVIGTNKHDAAETVAALLADLRQRPAGLRPVPEDLVELLRHRGVRVVLWSGWQRIEAAEARLGQTTGRPTAKITGTRNLVDVATGRTPELAALGSRGGVDRE